MSLIPLFTSEYCKKVIPDAKSCCKAMFVALWCFLLTKKQEHQSCWKKAFKNLLRTKTFPQKTLYNHDQKSSLLLLEQL